MTALLMVWGAGRASSRSNARRWNASIHQRVHDTA